MALLCVHVLLLARFLSFFSLLNFLGFDLGHLSCHIPIATLLFKMGSKLLKIIGLLFFDLLLLKCIRTASSKDCSLKITNSYQI